MDLHGQLKENDKEDLKHQEDEDIVDHCSYVQNLSSCKIEA